MFNDVVELSHWSIALLTDEFPAYSVCIHFLNLSLSTYFMRSICELSQKILDFTVYGSLDYASCIYTMRWKPQFIKISAIWIGHLVYTTASLLSLILSWFSEECFLAESERNLVWFVDRNDDLPRTLQRAFNRYSPLRCWFAHSPLHGASAPDYFRRRIWQVEVEMGGAGWKGINDYCEGNEDGGRRWWAWAWRWSALIYQLSSVQMMHYSFMCQNSRIFLFFCFVSLFFHG